MAERNHYAQPMDFEYENKRGTVDPSSPFVTSLKQSQQSSFSSAQGDLGAGWRLQSDIEQSKRNSKRPFAQYDSPQKIGGQDTNIPTLRPPGNGQSVLFSNTPAGDTKKKLPALPSTRDSLWTTPRKVAQVIDFSSGGETPDTENWKADSEATPDTPSMGLSSRLSKLLGSANKKTPSKSTRQDLLSKPSPGRGEIAKPYSQKVVSRVQKRREIEVTKSKRRKLLKGALQSDSEDDAVRGSQQAALGSEKKGFDIAGIFTYIETHPHLPHVLSFYAQLALNVFLIFGIMYILYSFWATIRSDVDKKSLEAMAEVLAEIAVCAKHWKDNQCDKGTPLPALEAVCREWEKCMNKDHKMIGRARVSAHTFAEIFNSFIEPISWKAMAFTAILVFGSFFICNATFNLFRKSHDTHPYMPPPPTPQRHASWEQHQYGFTPYGSQYGLPPPNWGQLEPAPSGASQGSQGSPRKLRELEGGRSSPRKQKQLDL